MNIEKEKSDSVLSEDGDSPDTTPKLNSESNETSEALPVAEPEVNDTDKLPESTPESTPDGAEGDTGAVAFASSMTYITMEGKWESQCFYEHLTSMSELNIAIGEVKKTEGAFLFRKSFSQACLTLTIIKDGEIVNTRISLHEDNEVYVRSDRRFLNVACLALHYKYHDIPNDQRITGVRILHPIIFLQDGTPGKPLPTAQDLARYFSTELIPAHQISRNKQPSLHQIGIEIKQRPKEQLPNEEGVPLYVTALHSSYSLADKEDCDVLPLIRASMKQKEGSKRRCDCGLSMADSQLPDGWEMHRSADADTMGRIFFMNADGMSKWELPDDVKDKLSAMEKLRLGSSSCCTDSC